MNISHITLDLDRGIYHTNYNLAKRDLLLKDHGDKIVQEEYLEREAWFVLRASTPGVSARDLAGQYGLEELRDFILRSRRVINAKRSQPFRMEP